MRRKDLYGREQLLAKIRGETERAHELLDARSALQEQRKLANMGASFQRQKLMQARRLTSALLEAILITRHLRLTSAAIQQLSTYGRHMLMKSANRAPCRK